VLRAQISWLKKQLFGGGRSEKLDRAQLLLQLGALEAHVAVPSKQTISYERTPGAREARTLPAENFEHLPVQETIEIVPEPVKKQPELYERIGEERTFEVDVIPPKLVKRVIVRRSSGTGWIGTVRRGGSRSRAARGGWLCVSGPARLGRAQQIRRPFAFVSPRKDACAMGRTDSPSDALQLDRNRGRMARTNLPDDAPRTAQRRLCDG